VDNPIVQFETWFAAARSAGVPQPEAMALATADQRGRPSVRMVLLKGWGPGGFEFYTNRLSRKGTELAANPYAALTLYWQPQGRSVRAAGSVRPISARGSLAYWNSRPLASQASAWASAQSTPLESREELEARQTELSASAVEGRLPLPPFWGGYRLRPDWIEFWEHRDDRLHRRVLYSRRNGTWTRGELQP